MKYNRAFLLAVTTVAQEHGDAAAETIFNKLFDINTAPVSPEVDVKTHSELMSELRQTVGGWVFHSDIRETNLAVGVPGCLGTNAVAWIKNFRERTSFGLKQSKDVYDFVRDNPTVLD
jgi:hypothetical protein